MPPTGIPVRRPYLFVAGIVALIAAVTLLSAGSAVALPQLPPRVPEFLAELILALSAITLLAALRAWRNVGFRALPRVIDLRLYWIPLLPVLPGVAAAVVSLSSSRFQDLVVFSVLALFIGFVEEVFFRGLILQALVPQGLWRAAIVSSVLFGLMHSLNLLFDADPAATLLQVVYATAMGFGFAAVTLRTGVLWPLIVVHTVIDFTGFATSERTVRTDVTPTDIVIGVLYTVVFVAYGILMMRSVTRRRAVLRTHPVEADLRS
ncbi:lysostaphin resistance A-like protein [Arthrobacter sp. NPDC092385]|uniref:CPBP family intramembrane glutamic endopeptidase n=1 Tax=Arthrobacter sp. NPDC092385 TaxID=3363943 RepID=UPI003818D0D8